MSYNLAFWAGGDDLDPTATYAQLADEQHVAGVAAIPQGSVALAFAEHLPNWRWDGQILQPPGAEPDGVPAFDVAIGAQMIEFIAYGFEPEHANSVIGAMHELGYRLFDPQVSKRFA